MEAYGILLYKSEKESIESELQMIIVRLLS
jgi:hypothetical protein